MQHAPETIDYCRLARDMLERSVAAWNRGELNEFLSIYANDADRLSRSSGLIVGRDNILIDYLNKYPTQARMGHLSIEVVAVRLLSGGESPTVSVELRFTLKRPREPDVSGHGLIIFAVSNRRFAIIHDAG